MGAERSRGGEDRPRAARLVAGARSDPWHALCVAILSAAAVAWLAVFLSHAHQIIVDLLWNSDYASGLTIAQTVAHVGSAGNTWISTTGAWMDLWFGLITAHLPLHRQLWEISPTILWVVCALAIGRSVQRLAGSVCAVASALIVLLVTPWGLQIFMAPVAHNTVYPTTAILGGVLPWILRHRARSRRAWTVIVVIAAIVLGTDLASDKLVLVTAILPLAALCVVSLWQRDRTVRAAALGTLVALVGAIPVMFITNAIMHAEGFFIVAPPLGFSSPSSWGLHVRMLFEGLRGFCASALLAPHAGPLDDLLGALGSVAGALALATLSWSGARALWTLRVRAHDAVDLGEHLHTAYWFISAVAVVLTFIVTNADATVPATHASYFITILFAVAASVPIQVSRWRRSGGRRSFLLAAAPLALAAVAVAGAVAVNDHVEVGDAPALASYAGEIVHAAQADHATYGYAGYWDASNRTWSSKGAVVVRPLLQCSNPNAQGAPICPFLLMRTASWYRPVHRRSFLLVDPTNAFVTTLPANLGKPIGQYMIGTIQMYVYPYDIASKLGPYPVWNP